MSTVMANAAAARELGYDDIADIREMIHHGRAACGKLAWAAASHGGATASSYGGWYTVRKAIYFVSLPESVCLAL